MSRDRLLLLDFIRITACFLIVLMHSPMPTVSENKIFVTAISFFTEPAIGLFFMVSGALLLPVKLSSFDFLKNRVIKIAIPIAAWTIFYLGFRLYYSESEINILHKLFSFPFSNQGPGIFWFLYTILGLYLLSPIISPWLQKVRKKELEFYLLIWGLSLAYPILELWITTNESATGILYYFTGYIGYYILGFYLKNFSGKGIFFISCFISILGLIVLIYLKLSNIFFDYYRLYWYLSIFIASWCVVYWFGATWLLALINNKILFVWLPTISNLTFGVYLVHFLIMRDWLWKSFFILNIYNYPLQTFIIAFLSFFISLAAVFIISRIPYLKIIVGFRFQAH